MKIGVGDLVAPNKSVIEKYGPQISKEGAASSAGIVVQVQEGYYIMSVHGTKQDRIVVMWCDGTLSWEPGNYLALLRGLKNSV